MPLFEIVENCRFEIKEKKNSRDHALYKKIDITY